MIGRMVGLLTDKQCDFLIELEQYRSLGFDTADIKKLKQKVDASTGLVKQS